MHTTQRGVECLKIDPAVCCEHISRFINEQLPRFHKESVAIGISGGVDSSVVLGLCARALGKDRVTGVMLGEKHGNPDAERFARMAADHFRISVKSMDITPVLEALGAYRHPLSWIPGRRLRAAAVKAFIRFYRRTRGNDPFKEHMQGAPNPLLYGTRAAASAKHRIRMVALCHLADRNNLLVAGAANRTEASTGLFVKFGIDDNADIMPIKDLYRTQVLQLAHFIGVPDEITSRTPNPDLIPGISDKYTDFLDVVSETLDCVLLGIEKGLTDTEIADKYGVSHDKAAEVRMLVHESATLRDAAIFPPVNTPLRNA